MARGTETRDRILDSAAALVMEHGFGSTSVDAVLEASGTSKGAFFHHFPSKVDLGRALVERYAADDSETLQALVAEAEAASDDPVEQLLTMVRTYEREAGALSEVQPGCLFVSFIYEADLVGPQTEHIVADSILEWRSTFLDKLEKAAAVRPALAAVDLPSLADQAFAAFEGGFLLTRALRDPAILRQQLGHFRHYVEVLVGAGGDGQANPGRDARSSRTPALSANP